jgi:WD40 repeat protein
MNNPIQWATPFNGQHHSMGNTMTKFLVTLAAAWMGSVGVTAAMPQNASKERRLKVPAGVQVNPPFCFSPDGSLVAALSQKGRRKNVEWRIIVWETKRGKVKQQLKGLREQIRWMAFADDGSSLVSISSKDGRGYVWDPKSGRRKKVVPLTAQDSRRYSALSPNGKWLATSFEIDMESGRTEVAELSSGALLWDDETHARSIMFASQANVLIVHRMLKKKVGKPNAKGEQRMSIQYSLVAKSATTGKTLWEVKRASLRGTTALAAIPSSDEFLFVNSTGVERRSVVTGELLSKVSLTTNPATDRRSFRGAMLSNDGRQLALHSSESRLEIWDLEASAKAGKPIGKSKAWGYGFALSPDLNLAVSQSRKRWVLVEWQDLK